MGRSIAERLIEVGHRVVLRSSGHSLDNESELLASGAVRPNGPADILILCLPDGTAVLDVLKSVQHAPALVIDCSSTSPAEAREAGKEVGLSGGRYVDCPVSGASALSRRGGLTAYVGADAHDPILAQIRALDLFRTIIACGPVGQGMALKLVNQAVHMVNLCALVDGAALAGALGLDPVLTMRGLAAGSAASTMLERFGDAIFLGADKAQFSAALARKDLDNVLESWALVPGTDGSLTMVAEAQAVVAGAIQRLGTDIDVSAIGRRGCE